jgi:hypothetical protein
MSFLITAEAVSDGVPDALLGAQRADGALVVEVLAGGAAGAGLGGIASLAAVVDVAGTTDAAVSHGGGVLLAGGHAANLVVEGDGGSLASLVGVAGSADAREEAAGVDSRGRAADGSGERHGGGVLGRGGAGTAAGAGVGAEGVTGTATAGAHVGGGGGSGLREDVVGRHFGCDLGLWMKMRWSGGGGGVITTCGKFKALVFYSVDMCG